MVSTRMRYNVASTKEECMNGLAQQNITLFYPSNWCNYTWDTFLCWPPSPVDTIAVLRCPPLTGLLYHQNVSKYCDQAGIWDDTNMTSCFDPSVLDSPPMEEVSITDTPLIRTGTNSMTHQSPHSSEVVEYVGLSLSILDILITMFLILCSLRRNWRINQVRMGLLSALLLMCLIWLAMRIDKSLMESTYSYKGIIYVHRPVCESFSGLLEWSKIFMASWLTCMSFHGLLEVVKNNLARRCMNLVFYGLFTIVYSCVAVGVWIVLVKFAEEPGHEFMCANEYEGRPFFHVIIWPCFILIAAATVLAVIHILRAAVEVCSSSDFPTSNKRRLLQGIVHLIICLYTMAFWYFNYMDAFMDVKSSPLAAAAAAYVVYFLGAFIAVLLGACQCCLPAK